MESDKTRQTEGEERKERKEVKKKETGVGPSGRRSECEEVLQKGYTKEGMDAPVFVFVVLRGLLGDYESSM